MKSMRYACCVPGCEVKLRKRNRQSVNNAADVILCLFPKEKEIFDIWLDRIGVDDFKKHSLTEVRDNIRICTNHFSSHCIVEVHQNGSRRLKPIKYGSLPTLGMPNFKEEPTKQNSLYRYKSPEIVDITHEIALKKPRVVHPPVIAPQRINGESNVARNSKQGPEPIIPVTPLPDLLVPNEEMFDISDDVEGPSPGDPMSMGKKRKKKKLRGSVVVSRSPPPFRPPVVDKTSEENVKLSEMFERVTADRPPLVFKRGPLAETEGEPGKRRLAFRGENESFDKFVIGTFNAAEKAASNAFLALNQPSQPSLVDHSYGSTPTIELLKSSAELCDFSERKLKALRILFETQKDEMIQLEEETLKFVNNVLDNHAVALLKECFPHIVSQMCKKHSKELDGEKIEETADVKQFLIILLMYSWKAYSILSPVLHLASPYDVRTWATSHLYYPGFTGSSIDWLKSEVSKAGRGYVLGCLAVKELPISRKIEWDGDNFVGCCDLGFGNVDSDFMPEASSVLVFYLTGLNKWWKLPLGYCLIDHASPSLRANLVIQYLMKTSSLGVRVIAVVADGSVHSYNMFKALGVSLEDVDGEVTSSFVHPSVHNDRVRCFVDVDDVVRSLTLCLKQRGALVTSEETIVDWSLVNKVHEFRDSDFTTTEAHRRINRAARHELFTIHLKLKKDRHPIGRHVPAALAYFKNAGLPEFVDALETCLFLENVFQFESLFKTYLLVGKDDASKKMSAVMSVFLNNVKTLINYFGWLKDLKEGVVFNTRKKLPVILILMNLISLKAITQLSVSRNFHFVQYTSKFTLKNLNGFVSDIQELVGDLPTALKFKKAYEEVLNPQNRKPPDIPGRDLEIFTTVDVVYEYAPIAPYLEHVETFLAERTIRRWVIDDAQCSDCIDFLMGSPIRGYLTEPVDGVAEKRRDITQTVVRVLRLVEKHVKASSMPTASTLDAWLDRVTRDSMKEIATSRSWFKNVEHLFECDEFGQTVHFWPMLSGLIRVFLRYRLELLRQNDAIKIRFPKNSYSNDVNRQLS